MRAGARESVILEGLSEGQLGQSGTAARKIDIGTCAIRIAFGVTGFERFSWHDADKCFFRLNGYHGAVSVK
jgi:hypothetical protein